MPKQSLLVAIESFFDGGAEMFAIRLANALSSHYRVHFFELKPFNSTEKKQKSLLLKHISVIAYGNNRINSYLLKLYGHSNYFYYAKKHQILAKWANQYSNLYLQFYFFRHRIQLVNSHSWDTDVFFASFKQQKKLRLTATLHGHYEFLATLRQQFQTQTAYALQQIDAVVYTTQTHLQTLAQYGYPQQKTHKILYGIAIENLPKLPINQPKQPLQLIMASRGIEEKGWWYAIEAVLAVNKQIPNSVQLTLLGEGAYLQQLKQTYQQEKALQFLPHTNNVIPILLSANIGLLPSYYIAESLPNIVIEYLLCGKPVIASQIGAIKEMLAANGEEAGFCLPLSEGKPLVNEVKNAILQYLRQPALLQKHSELAVVAAQKFKMAFCVQQYCELFNRL